MANQSSTHSINLSSLRPQEKKIKSFDSCYSIRTAAKNILIPSAIQTTLHLLTQFLQQPYLKGIKGNFSNVRVGGLILCF